MSKFEIPQAISRDRIEDENYYACYDAARKREKHLRKAEYDLEEVATFKTGC